MVNFAASLLVATVMGFLAGMGVGGGSLLLLWLTQVVMLEQTQARIINALYDNYDGVRLLLCHAEGTRHADFLHDFVSDVTSRSHRFIKEAHK